MDSIERRFGVMFSYAAVCLLSAVIQVQGSKLLDSLECYNDYNSLVTCTWTANRPYEPYVNMTLYEKRNSRNTTCKSLTQTNLTWTCLSENDIYVTTTEQYHFQPDRNLEKQLNLTDKGTGLTENPNPITYYNDDGYFLLWSEANYAPDNQTQEISECESRYKEISENWENSSMAECINVWAVYKPKAGKSHVAQMRVKYNNGHWSNWSSEVVLEPKTAEDEAKPQNLRCIHLSGQVLCAWEVRVEVADVVSFKLFYKETESNKDKKCSHTCQMEVPNVPYISCRCSIKTENFNPASWQISVKPEKEVKTIIACDNVRYGPPINLSIHEKEQGQLYQARWSTETISNSLTLRYQICYWREGQFRKNKTFPDCQYELKEKPMNEDRVVALRLGNELGPSSNYKIKVRMGILNLQGESMCPRGPWSEWSKTENWKTKTAPNHMPLYIVIPICIIILIVFCIYGNKCMRRYKSKWEELIPDPSKSNLILNFEQKRKSQLNLNCPDYREYEELTDSCRINDPIDMIPEKEKRLSTLSHSNLIYWNPPEVPNEEDKYNETTITIASGYQPFEELVHVSQSKVYSEDHFAPFKWDDKEHKEQQSQFVPIDFNGPYIFYP
ncbi:cytokine receptor common subunit beta isoform X2 [Xenopus laevis]|uniref:Cytokine receptor common subunit beta isoform X2 n=1 Tax=Xenopus laevis TaxID=8355 RepID=A0A8J1MSI7_XENLA|nr:cytokine receptor common subunit beta isoform X2 [Xenopus laevis]